MKSSILLFFILSYFNGNTHVSNQHIDSLPEWKVFKKMNKEDLLELYKDDTGAIKVINGSKKSFRRGAAISGGLAVLFGIGTWYFSTTGGVEWASLISLFGTITFGLAAFGLAFAAIFFLIMSYTGSKRRMYKQLKKKQFKKK
jgi:hypothetical protein